MDGKRRDFYITIIRPKLYKAHTVMQYFDKFPLLPANLAEDILSLIRLYNHYALLRNNREYAELNVLQKKKPRDFQALSNLLDLYHSLSPEGGLERNLRKVAKYKLTGLTRFVLDTLDLIFKGYKESQLWDLDYDISDRLGRMLIELSSVAHGWPASEQYKTFTDWQSALKEHGNSLTAYAERDLILTPLYLESVKLKKEGEIVRAKEAMRTHNIKEKEILRKARVALDFVAKNHSNLWD